jgi:hypothetical protein
METDGTSYTVAQAAKVLERTPKRVRQMISEGKLPTLDGVTPVRIPAEAVHTARNELRSQGPRSGPSPKPQGLTAEDVRALVSELMAGQREILSAERQAAEAARDRAEELLRDALAEERLKRQDAEAEAKRLRDELDTAQAGLAVEVPKRRGLFRRK